MAQFKFIKTGFFRVIAFTLLAVSAGFSFPESHFSTDRTFVKAPSPQTEICSFLTDDVEDSNDFATDTHFIHDAVIFRADFLLANISTGKLFKRIDCHFSDLVYLRHRQLLI